MYTVKTLLLLLRIHNKYRTAIYIVRMRKRRKPSGPVLWLFEDAGKYARREGSVGNNYARKTPRPKPITPAAIRVNSYELLWKIIGERARGETLAN